MRTIKMLLIGAVAVAGCFAQIVNISGKVTDTGAAPIAGATVSLEKIGLTTTSGADGSFTLSGSSGVIERNNRSSLQWLPASLYNGVLYINTREKSSFEITTYDLQGQVVASARKILDAGRNSLPLRRKSPGIFLYRVKIEGNEFLIKGASINGVMSGAPASLPGRPAGAMAKTAVINDVIAVKKIGYLNYRVMVTNADTSGIGVTLIVCADTVTDVEGNAYQAVRIGNKIWTTENLRTTKYNDGSLIPSDTSTATWNNAATPKYCFYENSTGPDDIKKYGALYNWYAINTGKLAPAGWHVPTDEEWTTLENFLIANGYNWDNTTTDNKIAKSLAAKADWGASVNQGDIGSDLTKNNRSGFSALPGGYRNYTGVFSAAGLYCNWWSATAYDASNAYGRSLFRNSYNLFGSGYNKGCGFSVRLMKNVKKRFTIVPAVNIASLGSITPDTPQLVDSGAASPRFVFKPKNRCAFESLTINGTPVVAVGAKDTAYTITSVVGDDTLKAWFANMDTGSMADVEGNKYRTIKIGNQVWSAENLRTTKYNDGSIIPLVTVNSEWANLPTPAYCFYGNMTNADSIIKYGALYNWYVIGTQRLAPLGWHIPTDAEWDTLQNYLISNGYNYDGTKTANKIAKAMAAKTGWNETSTRGAIGNNPSQNNQSGFSAVAAGSRYFGDGSFTNIGKYAYWWSATLRVAANPWYRDFYFDYVNLERSTYSGSLGFSVRLVKD